MKSGRGAVGYLHFSVGHQRSLEDNNRREVNLRLLHKR